ncbi:MAG: GNAT family N-acetyltransferase [Dehalococcoidales bacterium]
MAIDFPLVKIITADDSHYEFIYRVKKEAYGEYITRIWGWDENLQKEFHAKDWASLKPSVILYNNEPIGTLCFMKKEGPIFLGRFFIEHFYILPEYQNKGIGAFVLKHFLDIADNAGLPVNLMVLSINPAASLYTRLGFKVIETKEPIIVMERKPGGNNAL